MVVPLCYVRRTALDIHEANTNVSIRIGLWNTVQLADETKLQECRACIRRAVKYVLPDLRDCN